MFNWAKKDRDIYAWVPTIVWGAVIFMFAVLPYVGHPELMLAHFDKLLHFFEYAFLAVLIMKGLYRTSELSSSRSALFTLIMGGGYGILMELVQQLVPGRVPTMGDALANIAGVFLGVFIGKVMLWQK